MHTAELSFAEHSNDPKLIGKVLPASCASSISATYPNGTGGWTWTWRLGGQAYPRELSYWINHPDFNPGAGPAVTHNWDANGGYHLDGYNQLVPNASCYDGIPKCDPGYIQSSPNSTCEENICSPTNALPANGLVSTSNRYSSCVCRGAAVVTVNTGAFTQTSKYCPSGYSFLGSNSCSRRGSRGIPIGAPVPPIVTNTFLDTKTCNLNPAVNIKFQ